MVNGFKNESYENEINLENVDDSSDEEIVNQEDLEPAEESKSPIFPRQEASSLIISPQTAD